MGAVQKKVKKTNNSAFSATHTYIKLTLVFFLLFFYAPFPYHHDQNHHHPPSHHHYHICHFPRAVIAIMMIIIVVIASSLIRLVEHSGEEQKGSAGGRSMLRNIRASYFSLYNWKKDLSMFLISHLQQLSAMETILYLNFKTLPIYQMEFLKAH